MKNGTYFEGATGLECEKIGNISYHQDGAIYGGYVFHINLDGACDVYSYPEINKISAFSLDKPEVIRPHCNSVCFGSEKFHKNDEFPLLYANVYNNYSGEDDKREGMCCVYRITRNESGFVSKLLQTIKIDFVHDESLWYSSGHNDARPYGNFVVDVEDRKLYAFVMRDSEQKTRFFEFELPSFKAGNYDEKTEVTHLTLSKKDITAMFDTDYMKYMQGAAYGESFIYSLEGIIAPEGLPLKLRVIDPKLKSEVFSFELADLGLEEEPEFIEVIGDKTVYADAHGNLYNINFIG